MNTIVVPTDFSPLADVAAQYGARLAQAIGGNLVLLNTYSIPVTMNDMPTIVISADGLKKNSEGGIARLKGSLQATYPQVPIKTETRIGDDVEELESICKDAIPFAIVMGVQPMSSMEEMFFGNSIVAAIRRLKVPVIAVQQNFVFTPPRTIVLATDLLNTDKVPVEKITTFVKTFNADFHIVHIEVAKEKEDDTKLTNSGATLLTKLNALQPAYTTIKDEDVVHGLQHYIQQNKADLLMLIPHEHNLVERLFFRLHAKNIITHLNIPVVSIAE